MNKDLIFASSFLANTIIGAGIFSLPFVFATVGVGAGVLYLTFFAAIYVALHLMYAHILSADEDGHDLAHFANKYLGSILGKTATYLVLVELLLVLTVYLILAPSFLTIVAGMGGVPAVVFFWIVASLFIFVDMKWLEWVAAGSVSAILIIVAVVFLRSIPHPLATAAFNRPDWFALLLPFGPLLFALNGRPGIARVVAVWRAARDKGSFFYLKHAILLGTLLPAAAYLLFTLGALKLNALPSQDAISGLAGALPPWLMVCLGALGLIAIWNSYFMIGDSVRKIFHDDMRCSRALSGALVVMIPLSLYLLGVSNFVAAVGFIGGTLLAFEGIIVVTIWRKVFPRSRFHALSHILYFVFFGAILYEFAQVVL